LKTFAYTASGDTALPASLAEKRGVGFSSVVPIGGSTGSLFALLNFWLSGGNKCSSEWAEHEVPVHDVITT